MIDGEFYPTAKTFNAPNTYRVQGILDLDGDGKLEVIVESHYYEGDAVTAYRCRPGKVEKLLSAGCGA